jgi:hypothetical protein
MPAAGLGPTLSQVQTWDTEHLTEAATQWTSTATVWGDAFSQLSVQMPCPGGSPWEGEAAEAAQHQGYTDRLTVMGLADRLHDASAIARAGAWEVDAAKQRVLAAVNAAREAGFTVGEDFSITSRESGTATAMAARQSQAQALSADIRMRLAELTATDQQVAAKIATAAAGVGTVRFAENGDDHGNGRPTVQAVDNRTLKQAPPQPEPPDPPPGPMPRINDADDVKRALDPLQNGGKRGPNGIGTNPDVKEVWDRGSMRQLWDYLTHNAPDSEGPPGFKGSVRILPDGTKIGFRQSTKGWGDTIDVWFPDGSDTKVHTPYAPYFPSIGAPPQLPPMGEPAPVPFGAPQTGHAPIPLPPSGILDPNGLPPWLQNPSTPGFHAPVQAPTIMPGVALPDAPSAPVTAPTDPGFLPDLAHDLAEAGTTAGAGALAGIDIIGGLIAGGVTPSGQIAR